jgi:hypothetical protein
MPIIVKQVAVCSTIIHKHSIIQTRRDCGHGLIQCVTVLPDNRVQPIIQS